VFSYLALGVGLGEGVASTIGGSVVGRIDRVLGFPHPVSIENTTQKDRISLKPWVNVRFSIDNLPSFYICKRQRLLLIGNYTAKTKDTDSHYTLAELSVFYAAVRNLYPRDVKRAS